MVVKIATVSGVVPITSTSATFLPNERTEVATQVGSHGTKLIRFTDPSDGLTYHGIVGIDAKGTRLLGSANLLAKPCPPFCPVKATARAVPYP